MSLIIFIVLNEAININFDPLANITKNWILSVKINATIYNNLLLFDPTFLVFVIKPTKRKTNDKPTKNQRITLLKDTYLLTQYGTLE